MEYVVIVIIAIIILVTGVILYVRSHKQKTLPSDVMVRKEEPELLIPVEVLPAEAAPDTDKLIEITDKKVLARINDLVPDLFQAGNAINNAVTAVEAANTGDLYKAIIPAGAKLVNSKNMEGAKRGIYRGDKGIKGHADLVSADIPAASVNANIVAAAMNIGAMVVGQYYMTQINDELDAIHDDISQIKDFLNNEYLSKIFSAISVVKSIADFQTEILENEEVRTAKLTQLDNIEHECVQLLTQANLTLKDFTKKTDLKYADYEKEVAEAENWLSYQKALTNVLGRIADLRYTLHLGTVSRTQCAALLQTCNDTTTQTLTQLSTWHNDTAKRLKIEVEAQRRKRIPLPENINYNWLYRSIKEETANMIEEQTTGYLTQNNAKPSELYGKDVQLISKDGKVYYLPGQDEENS